VSHESDQLQLPFGPSLTITLRFQYGPSLTITLRLSFQYGTIVTPFRKLYFTFLGIGRGSCTSLHFSRVLHFSRKKRRPDKIKEIRVKGKKAAFTIKIDQFRKLLIGMGKFEVRNIL
jgi:hypothetical protein